MNLSCFKKYKPSEYGRHIQRRRRATFALRVVGVCAHLCGWHQPRRAAWARKFLFLKVALLSNKKLSKARHLKNTKKNISKVCLTFCWGSYPVEASRQVAVQESFVPCHLCDFSAAAAFFCCSKFFEGVLRTACARFG